MTFPPFAIYVSLVLLIQAATYAQNDVVLLPRQGPAPERIPPTSSKEVTAYFWAKTEGDAAEAKRRLSQEELFNGAFDILGVVDTHINPTRQSRAVAVLESRAALIAKADAVIKRQPNERKATVTGRRRMFLALQRIRQRRVVEYLVGLIESADAPGSEFVQHSDPNPDSNGQLAVKALDAMKLNGAPKPGWRPKIEELSEAKKLWQAWLDQHGDQVP
jgi:hypothetical protein